MTSTFLSPLIFYFGHPVPQLQALHTSSPCALSASLDVCLAGLPSPSFAEPSTALLYSSGYYLIGEPVWHVPNPPRLFPLLFEAAACVIQPTAPSLAHILALLQGNPFAGPVYALEDHSVPGVPTALRILIARPEQVLAINRITSAHFAAVPSAPTNPGPSDPGVAI